MMDARGDTFHEADRITNYTAPDEGLEIPQADGTISNALKEETARVTAQKSEWVLCSKLEVCLRFVGT